MCELDCRLFEAALYCSEHHLCSKGMNVGNEPFLSKSSSELEWKRAIRVRQTTSVCMCASKEKTFLPVATALTHAQGKRRELEAAAVASTESQLQPKQCACGLVWQFHNGKKCHLFHWELTPIYFCCLTLFHQNCSFFFFFFLTSEFSCNQSHCTAMPLRMPLLLMPLHFTAIRMF